MRKLFFGGSLIASTALALALSAQAAAPAGKAEAIPDFSANNSAWLKLTNLWDDPPAGTPGLGPLHTDPAHPFRTRGLDAQGRDDSGSGRVGDWHDPNLKPRAAQEVKAWGEAEAKGDIQVTASAACQPPGVPGVHMMNEPLYIVQKPDEVVMVWQRGMFVRHVFLNVPHSKNPEPTWHGESVGHYEGDELVIDTIGLRAGQQIDHFGVTSSPQMHVVERIKMVDNGNALQVVFKVDDPGTYNQPWSGMMKYRHVKSTLIESICSENNMDYFTGKLYPLPIADKPDF